MLFVWIWVALHCTQDSHPPPPTDDFVGSSRVHCRRRDGPPWLWQTRRALQVPRVQAEFDSAPGGYSAVALQPRGCCVVSWLQGKRVACTPRRQIDPGQVLRKSKLCSSLSAWTAHVRMPVQRLYYRARISVRRVPLGGRSRFRRWSSESNPRGQGYACNYWWASLVKSSPCGGRACMGGASFQSYQFGVQVPPRQRSGRLESNERGWMQAV